MPIQLPSQCLPYEGLKPENILVRPYNGEDEILLAQINPTNIERNFLAVLRNVVQGIEPEKLTIGDRLYIIIWEYVNSYSNVLILKQTCSHCLQKVDFVIDMLKDVKIQKLADNYKDLCSFDLPENKEHVEVKVLTVADEVEAEKMSVNGQDPHLYRIARSITNCDNAFAHVERMKKWQAKDIARIRKFHDIDAFHGPTSNAQVKCPHCGEEEDIIVPFLLEFLYPTGETLGDCFRT